MPNDAAPDFSVTLPYDKRVRGRLRVVLDQQNQEAGINIERGDLLRDGSHLGDADGHILRVLAEPEAVSVATTHDAELFAKACYHVGNRHAQVQITQQQLIYLHDHVLDQMLQLLGLSVTQKLLPFEPENGAYTDGHQHASHSHS